MSGFTAFKIAPVGIPLRRASILVLLIALVFSACSTPERETAPSEAAGQGADDGCAIGADRAVERLDGFLAELPEQSPAEFLDQDEVPGLAAFQEDIATIIAEATDQRSTLCNLDGFQGLIAERLTEVEPEGVLATFLVNTILRGGELETADVQVGPDDDVEAVLALLDDGSTITFDSGSYNFVRPLIVQREIAMLGQGVSQTTLSSSAADAVFVVVGRGDLTIRDMTVAHSGLEQASVIIAFGRPVDLASTTLRGGIADSEGSGGNGLVLTDDVFGSGERDLSQRESVISNTRLEGNMGAGLVVDGVLAPTVTSAEILDNGICGICFFGGSSGTVANSRLEGNTFGVQAGDDSTPNVTNNDVASNTVAGVVVVGNADVQVVGNRVVDNLEAGIVIQEMAAALIAENEVGVQPFGLSILSTGAVTVTDNTFDGPEVGIQVDEAATPSVERNTVLGTTAVGIAHAGSSAGSFVDNTVEPADGVGSLAEGTASPDIAGLRVVGGELAVAYSGSASGELSRAHFSEQDIGIQIDGTATPTVTDLTVDGVASAAIVVRGESSVVIERAMISDFGEVGIAVADGAFASVNKTTVQNGRNGASLVGTGAPTLTDSTFTQVEVGIQVGESATPRIVGNVIEAPSSAGLVFIDDAAGEATRNRITDPGLVAVQLGGNAAPELVENVLFLAMPTEGALELESVEDVETAESEDEPSGANDTQDDAQSVDEIDALDSIVGMLYAGSAAGTAERNQVIGFVIGFQVGDAAAPELVKNVIDGGVWLGVGFLYRDDAGGRAEGNSTANHGVGFQLSDRSTPTVISNDVSRISDVAFLVQGVSNPVLERNICAEGAAGIGLLDNTSPTLIDNLCVEVSG